MTSSISAKCACGALRFQSTAAPVMQVICHCADCRAATGRSFCETAFFRTGHGAITGPQSVTSFVAASGARTERVACSRCRTVMFDTSDRFPDIIGVLAETIEPPFVAKPACHMWVSSKVASSDITDGLPQHAQGLS